MTIDDRLIYRLVLAIDIEGFSRRNAEQQQRAQADLCSALDSAAARAGLDRGLWHRQDRGDGELAVLPEGIDIPRVVGDLVHGLESALGKLNRRRDHHSLRVRLALHHGTLTDGHLGPVGDAPIMASRLVDVEAGRRHLRTHPERDITVIVSGSLYHDVISTGFCPMDPADFEAFRVVIKDIPYDGYLYPKQPAGTNGTDRPFWRPHHPRHVPRIKPGARFARTTTFRHRPGPA